MNFTEYTLAQKFKYVTEYVTCDKLTRDIIMPQVQLFAPEQLLILWKPHEEELTFAEINTRARKQFKDLIKVHRRTIIRYLNLLIEQKLLEKRVDSSHQSYYRKTKSGIRRTLILYLTNLLEELSIDGLMDLLDYSMKKVTEEQGPRGFPPLDEETFDAHIDWLKKKKKLKGEFVMNDKGELVLTRTYFDYSP